MTIILHNSYTEENDRELPIEINDLSEPPVATSKSPTCGRVKLPHLVMRDEGAEMLRGRSSLRHSGRGLLQAPALALKLEQVAVVQQSVE